MTSDNGPLFNPNLKPISSKPWKVDAILAAQEHASRHWDLLTKIKQLEQAGVILPTLYEDKRGFSLVDMNARGILVEGERDRIMAQYVNDGPIAADKFSEQCEWCGWALGPGEKCPRPGCKGGRRGT